MRGRIFALAIVFLMSSPVHADGLEDASAAASAFQGGDYHAAVSLYTRAATDKHLSIQERASLIYNRGMAFLKLGDHVSATADFQTVLRLVPNDPDAIQQLAALHPQKGRRSVQRIQPVQGPQIDVQKWGPFSSLAGHDWLGSSGKPVMYLHYEWSIPNAVLLYSGQDASGRAIAGQVTVDLTTHQLTEQATYGNKTSMGSYQVEPDRLITTTGEGRKQTQQILVRSPDGFFQLTVQKRNGNEWKTTQIVVFTPTTPTFVAGLGWPAPGSQVRESFFKRLGRSLGDGALAGLHDGTRDGLHDAAQDRIRRVTRTTGEATTTTRTIESQ